MKMKRKRRKSKDMMDDKAFMRAITRLRKGDQYLKRERGQTDNQSDLAGMHYTVWYYLAVLEVHRKVGRGTTVEPQKLILHAGDIRCVN